MSYGIVNESNVRKLTENGDVLFGVKNVFGDYIGSDESTVNELSLDDVALTDSMDKTVVNNFDEYYIVTSSKTNNTISFEVNLVEFDFNLLVTVSNKKNTAL